MGPRLLIFLGAAAVLFLRKPDALLHPQFWAEDGLLFFKDSLLAPVSSFFVPYQGYLHTLPRLIALAASFLPCSIVPATYNIASWLILAGSCARLMSPRLEVRYKPLFALAPVLVPHLGGESFLNLTNAHWVLAPLLVALAVQASPERPRELVSDCLVLALVGLSGPFVVICAPLFVVRALRERSRSWYILTAVALAVAAVQAGCMALYGAVGSGFDPTLGSWAKVFGLRLVGSMFLTQEWALLAPPVLLAVLSLAAPLWVWLLAGGEPAKLRLIVPFQFVAAANLAVLCFRGRAWPESLANFGWYERYFFNIYVMTAWSLVVCLGSALRRRRIAALLLALMLAISLTGFKAPPYRKFEWATSCREIGGPARVRIPINPEGALLEFPPGLPRRDD